MGSYVRSFILYRRNSTDGTSMMNEDNRERFKDDIEKAERYILIVSWIGIVSAFALMGCAFWGLM